MFAAFINIIIRSGIASVMVHWEPQQIFMGVNTEYRAKLVQARVNVPIALLHTYLVGQYKLCLTSEVWEGFTEPSKPSLEYYLSDKQ